MEKESSFLNSIGLEDHDNLGGAQVCSGVGGGGWWAWWMDVSHPGHADAPFLQFRQDHSNPVGYW